MVAQVNAFLLLSLNVTKEPFTRRILSTSEELPQHKRVHS
jgi:hypothetical protein